ncbi:MSHA biogenesis protein MshG [Vibrio astriarenae]|nr:MSHA biogenesis protein MshG [Vibrio sp. C7]
MLAAIFGGLFAFQAWVRTAEGQEKWGEIRLRIPIVGGIVNRALMARFSRTFA